MDEQPTSPPLPWPLLASFALLVFAALAGVAALWLLEGAATLPEPQSSEDVVPFPQPSDGDSDEQPGEEDSKDSEAPALPADGEPKVILLPNQNGLSAP